jgi:hypothetical protein
MVTLTPEQQRAIALARARQAQAAATRDAAPAEQPQPVKIEHVNPATGNNVPEFAPVGQDGQPLAGYDPSTGEMHPVMSKAQSVGYGFADIGGSGFADEAAAGLGYLIDKLPGHRGSSYDQILDHMRSLDAEAAQQNPKSYLGGQLGGAAALALATRGAGFLPNAESLVGRMIGGGLTGATYGGAHGFGSGKDGVINRLMKAGQEGTIGAVAGTTLPAVFSGLGAGGKAIVDALLGRRTAAAAGASPEAVKIINRIMESDGTRGPVGRANIAAAGPDAMMVDAGPAARSVLDAAIQRAGPGAIAARDAVAGRTGAAALQIDDALTRTLGAPQGVKATRTAIRQGSAAVRGNAYDDAYSRAIDYAAPEGMALENMVRTRVPASAIRRANELMRIEGNQSNQMLARIGDDGSVTFATLPDVRQLDYITRGLNDVAASAEGTGALGGQNALGRAHQGLSREIRQTLRGLVPEYGRALDTAADPIRRSQAVELGSRMLSPAMRRDEVAEAIAGMSQAERAALTQGIRSQIDDTLANVRRTMTDSNVDAREGMRALQELSSRAAREKLAMVIGDDEAGALFRDLDQAAQAYGLRASVAENSKTFARQETDRTIDELIDPGVLGKLSEGKPLEAGKRLIQAATGQTPADQGARKQEIYGEIARLLTRPASQNEPLFRAIEGQAQVGRLNDQMDRVVRALSGSRSIFPTTTLLEERRRSR